MPLLGPVVKLQNFVAVEADLFVYVLAVLDVVQKVPEVDPIIRLVVTVSSPLRVQHVPWVPHKQNQFTPSRNGGGPSMGGTARVRRIEFKLTAS